ncbi:MAG: ParB/RepB/Spo0J family partition protein [Trueperaceae bacterium]|nr:ParB/RepB/Spo0J family partition protein [Trueperaceae bacterium]
MSPRPKGLGRGLDSLLPKSDASVRQVPLEDLRVSPLQPRQHFDDAGLAELAASIAEKGVVQPLIARPVDDGLEIVAGERRYRAAQRAGLATVPVIVRTLSDRQTLEVAIIENLQREDLSAPEEARAFKRLLEFGLTQEEVAQAVGKSRSAVANTLRLLSLPSDALEALEVGTITAGHARAILSQGAEDREWALRQVIQRALSVRQAEGLRRPAPGPAGRPAARDDRYASLAEDLTRHVGTRVTVAGGTRGVVQLHFHDRDELERLLELLGYTP